jgi:hypothetical protein
MRKFPILVILLTTMIASTLTSILVSNSFLPLEGYSYDSENLPVELIVEGETEYDHGDSINYSDWSYEIHYEDGSVDFLTSNSEFLSFDTEDGSSLAYPYLDIIVTFEDSLHGVSPITFTVSLTISRVLNDFSFISGTQDFIYNQPIDYSDWLFELTYTNGDNEQINAIDPNITFSIPDGSPLTHDDTYIYVDYNTEEFYSSLTVPITIERIVTSVTVFSDTNPIDGEYVDYSTWDFEFWFSDGSSDNTIGYEDLTEISPSNGAIWRLADDEVYIRYVDIRTSVDVDYSYGVDVEEMAPDYSIGIITPPNINTYFVGDSLDFTGFQVKVVETSYATSVDYDANSVELFIYSMVPYVVLSDGYFLTEFDLITKIHFQINTFDFSYDSFVDGGGFDVTVYPEPTYQLNFKTLVDQDVSVETDSRQAFIVGDATWLIKANEPTSLQSVEALDSPGLVIGDVSEADFATEISFLSSSLWGVGGAADGYPIIESIYLKAYSDNDTQVEFFINGESVEFNSLNTEAGEDWIVFTIDQTTLRVGHLEMRLHQAAGDTPITLEELSIVSSNDGDPSLMDMLVFANDIEALDTCTDQSTFLTDHQSDYDSYVGSFNTTFTGLKLLDLSTPESSRDELRVTLGDKWAMMDSLYGDDGVPLPSREFNQPANTTNTFWLGFSLILILFTFFWKKRTSDILR